MYIYIISYKNYIIILFYRASRATSRIRVIIESSRVEHGLAQARLVGFEFESSSSRAFKYRVSSRVEPSRTPNAHELARSISTPSYKMIFLQVLQHHRTAQKYNSKFDKKNCRHKKLKT